MIDEVPRFPRVRKRILVGIAAIAALAITYGSIPQSIADAYSQSGWEGIYYRVKDKWPWASPNIHWESADPDSQGIAAAKLDAIWDQLSEAGTTAFLVVRNNRIVAEYYGPSKGPNRQSGTSAVGKTITAAMILILAIDDKQIDLDNYVYQYVPEWQDIPWKKDITIRQIVTHSSGLDNVEFGRSDLSGWKKAYYDSPAERFRIAIEAAPVLFEPGSQFAYSGLGFYALAYALGTSLKYSAQPDMKKLLASRVMEPLGIPQHDWSISYGQSNWVDGMRLYSLGSGGSYTPRAIARIGQLLLNRGQWNGRQLLDAKTVDVMMAYGGLPPEPQLSPGRHPVSGGIGVWSNCDGYWSSLPRDAMLGLGGTHSFLLVVPSLDLVVVRMGGRLLKDKKEMAHWQVLDRIIFTPLSDAIMSPGTAAIAASCAGMRMPR